MGRREATTTVLNHVRTRRLAAGLSQQQLATQSGLTRQAISAIEAGQYLPNTAVALRLARVLGGGVEALFSLLPAPVVIQAFPVDDRAPAPLVGDRVWAAQIGGERFAERLRGERAMLTSADGLVVDTSADTVDSPPKSLALELLVAPQHLSDTVVLAGCDPATAILAGHLGRRFPALHLRWRPCNSSAALDALRRGTAHVAGTHLQDPSSGVWNLPAIGEALSDRAVVVLTLATWQEGLLLAPGNPKGIGGVADLARADVGIVNREAGSGSRRLLDTALARAGVERQQVRGYDRQLSTHIAIGEAVAAGLVDAGCGVESVAHAFGLAFLPLQQERYDLVIPQRELHHPPVQALLDVIASAPYRRELAALGGYDTGQTGAVVAELGA